MIKAVLFDLDGTLIDSEHFYLECWNEILAEVGAKLTFNDWWTNYAGKPMLLNAKMLADKYGIKTPANELIERRAKLTVARFKTVDVRLMPFVPEILDFFREKGLTLAIVTSSQRKDVEAIFERNGLGHFFKLLVTRTDVANSKPHPESYDRCRELLGLEKEECIVFEDTLTGLTAAKAAGLVCFAIQIDTAEHPKLAIADEIFLDFNEAKHYIIQSGQL